MRRHVTVFTRQRSVRRTGKIICHAAVADVPRRRGRRARAAWQMIMSVLRTGLKGVQMVTRHAETACLCILHLRSRAPKERRRLSLAPQNACLHRRPLGQDTHLQLSAGAHHRPPHQLHHLQPRRLHGRRHTRLHRPPHRCRERRTPQRRGSLRHRTLRQRRITLVPTLSTTVLMKYIHLYNSTKIKE